MLTQWDYVMALGLGIFVVFLATLLVCCLNCEGWPGYRCLRDEPQVTISPPIGNIMMRHIQNTYENRGSVITASSRDSTYSTMSEKTDTDRSVRQNSFENVQSKLNEPYKPTEVELNMKYCLNREGTNGKFHIKIMTIHNLLPKPYPGCLEAYAVIGLHKGKTHEERMKSTHFEAQTEIIRHNTNPKFEQLYVIEAKRLDIRDYFLKITTYDKDKFSCPTELTILEMPLKDLRDFSRDFGELETKILMEPSIRDYGRILIGLSYLPTAQRLCLTIVRADSLKYFYINGNLEEFKPFARLYHLSGASRVTKRKKTTVRQATDSPVFNETITFSMTPLQLESATILICIASDVTKEDSSNGSTEHRERPVHLGKLALGSKVRNQGALVHWAKAMEANRTVITMWHSLY